MKASDAEQRRNKKGMKETMRSSNPVLSKAEGWQAPPPQAYQPYETGYQQVPQAPVGRMTMDDVITKSAITMGTLVAVAAITFLFMPLTLLAPAVIVSALVAFGTVLLVSFRRKVSPGFVLLYAGIEGVFIGGVSKLYESMWNGIVPAAVLGTLVAAGATLLAYKGLRIKVSSKFRKMVMIGTLAYAGVLMLNFILSLFGINFLFAGGNLGLMLAISALGVGLAVFNLILDFDYVEQGVAAGVPAEESWRAAFGLTVTMVWLYIELLRLLSYFRSN